MSNTPYFKSLREQPGVQLAVEIADLFELYGVADRVVGMVTRAERGPIDRAILVTRRDAGLQLGRHRSNLVQTDNESRMQVTDALGAGAAGVVVARLVSAGTAVKRYARVALFESSQPQQILQLAAPASIAEGQTLTATVTLSRGTAISGVAFSITGVAPEDIGPVVFGAGATLEVGGLSIGAHILSFDISIPVLADLLTEGAETLTIHVGALSAAVGIVDASLAPAATVIWAAGTSGISKIDTETGEVLSVHNTAENGSYGPATMVNGVIWSSDSMSMAVPYNTATGLFGAPVDVAPGDYPTLWCSVASPDGAFLYVGDFGYGRIYKISMATSAVVATLPFPGYNSVQDMDISADGSVLFATVEASGGVGGLARVATSSMTTIGITPISAAGEYIHDVLRHNGKLYVAGGTRVHRLTESTGALETSVEPSASWAPHSFAVVGDKLWVGAQAPRMLFRLALDTLALEYNFGLLSGVWAHDMTLGPDGKTLYIAYGSLIAYDTQTLTYKSGYVAPNLGYSSSAPMIG